MVPIRVKCIGIGTIAAGAIASAIALYMWRKTGSLFQMPSAGEMLLHVSFFTGFLYMKCWSTLDDSPGYLLWTPGTRGVWFWLVTTWLLLWIVSGVNNLLGYII